MAERKPNVIVIGGPNGAGKSTAARRFLKGAMRVTEFVNADVIAQGLSAFEPEKVAITAGRIMLTRLRELAMQRENFAFETTLASRSFAPWIAELCATGYAKAATMFRRNRFAAVMSAASEISSSFTGRLPRGGGAIMVRFTGSRN
jgi:predicted ABC-type ATPase